MEFEKISAYFSSLKSRWYIYRSQFDRERFYFAMLNGTLCRLPSVTTILDATLPTPEWLIKWIARMGYEKAMEKRTEAAHYGTLFSITVADFLRNKAIDLDSIGIRVQTYAMQNNLNIPEAIWTQRLKEDVFSLHSFVYDYQFEPLAIELPLVSAEHRFAGTLDAVGYMNIGSGVNGKILKRDKETRRVLAIMDWKTGRHGFYRNNEAQLQMYKLLFLENFPEFADAELRLFNWAPKEWESPEDQKYTIKDQTESKEKDRILHYIAIYRVENDEKDFKFKSFEGVLKLNADSSENFKIVDYADIIKSKFSSNTLVYENDGNGGKL